ncbi:MAG: outer membrane beta-barrel protein [Acidobacteriota bacterium]
MNRVSALPVLLILMSRPAVGQAVPKYELFGGYSYYRLQKSIFFDHRGNTAGWNGAATLNVTSWLGLVADVGAHYSPQETTSDRERSVTSSLDTYRGFFGPRFTLRGNNKLVPFIQPLVGVVHFKRDAFGTAGGQPFSNSISKTGLALAAGAGLDISAGDRLGVRIIQADHVLDRFTDSRFTPAKTTSRGLRLSFGVVLRLGKI